MEDGAWAVRRDNPRALASSIFEANSEDPDQMPHNVASDLGLHCLPMTLLRIGGQTILNLTCTMIASVDLAR